jgi:hypothetical protein
MHYRTCTRSCTRGLLDSGAWRRELNGSEFPVRLWLSRGKLHCGQREDQRDTEPHVSPNIDPRDPGSLYIREPPMEMANPIGRHCSLLDKYGMQ